MQLHKEFGLNVKFIDLQCLCFLISPFPKQFSIEACKKLESTTDFMSLPITIPSLAATCYRFLKQEISKINQCAYRKSQMQEI